MIDFHQWLAAKNESGAPYRNLEKSPKEYPPAYYMPAAADMGVMLQNRPNFLNNTKKKKKHKKKKKKR